MDFWTIVTSYVCSVTSLVSNPNACQAQPPPDAIKHVDNQVQIVPVVQETNSYLPIGIQIVAYVLEQTLDSQMKQIVYDSFISKELSSPQPATLVDDPADTGAPATGQTPFKTNNSGEKSGSATTKPGSSTTKSGSSTTKSVSSTAKPGSPEPRSLKLSVETETPQPKSCSTEVETEAPQTESISTRVETEAPQLSDETEMPDSKTFSTPVETKASTERGNFELLRAKYESQLKRIMVSELFGGEREPVEEGLLFKSDSGAGTVSNEQDSLPGSKQDPNYWQPDVDRLLDSIKVAEMFRQITPELLWLGELRDHMISESIHKRLRHTSGLSSNVIQFLYQIDNVNARDQTLIILRKILQNGDITEEKTVELAHRIMSFLHSKRSRLSKIIARCTSIRYS